MAGICGQGCRGVIFVFGVARSGTSAVARVLEQRFGVDMGGPGLVRPANPDGIYERDRLTVVDRALGSGNVSVLQWAEVVREELGALSEPWGYKHPMNAHAIPLYLTLYPRAIILLVRRDPDATADSWARTYRMGRDSAVRAVTKTREHIALGLRRIDVLDIDMTERLTDDEIVERIRGYRGLEPVA